MCAVAKIYGNYSLDTQDAGGGLRRLTNECDFWLIHHFETSGQILMSIWQSLSNPAWDRARLMSKNSTDVKIIHHRRLPYITVILRAYSHRTWQDDDSFEYVQDPLYLDFRSGASKTEMRIVQGDHICAAEALTDLTEGTLSFCAHHQCENNFQIYLTD